MTIKEFDEKYGAEGFYASSVECKFHKRLHDIIIPQLEEKLAKTPKHWKRYQKYLDRYNTFNELYNDLLSVKGA